MDGTTRSRTTPTGVRLALVTAPRPEDGPFREAFYALSRGLACRVTDAFRRIFRGNAPTRPAGTLPTRVRDLLADGAAPAHVEALLCAAVRDTVRQQAAAVSPRPVVFGRIDRRRAA